MSPDLSSSIRTRFGFASFRAGQEEAIQSLLNKQHTLAIMPTGTDKLFNSSNVIRIGLLQLWK